MTLDIFLDGGSVTAVRELKNSIYYVHAKDTRIEKDLVNINGLLDTKPIDCFSNRSWNYVALGHGHAVEWWKDFFYFKYEWIQRRS